MVKKAQLKIQQTAFMLIAVTLFFVLVGMFFIVIQLSSLKDTATEIKEREALSLVTKLANSPEFSCGESFGTRRTDCIDFDKIFVLKDNIGKYKGFWGISNIEIRKVYPESENIVCNSDNYPDCNIIRILEGEIKGISVSNFVSLCRKENYEGDIYDKCDIAKLMISYEEVE